MPVRKIKKLHKEILNMAFIVAILMSYAYYECCRIERLSYLDNFQEAPLQSSDTMTISYNKEVTGEL